MRGCAGAESNQARILKRMIPPPLALHARLNLYRFRVLLISGCPLVFLFVSCPCLDLAGARFGLGLSRGLQVSFG